MRKLVTRIFIFAFLFLILVKAVGYLDNIDGPRNVDPNIVRVLNAHRFDSLDILFVGSSLSYNGINPAYFDSIGLRTYNVSVSAAGPYVYELLTDDYLHSVKQKPASVFMLMAPTTFMDKTDDFPAFEIHRYLYAPLTNEQLVKKYDQWINYPALLLKSFQQGFRNITFRGKASMSIIQNEIKAKGFYSSDEVTSAQKEKIEFPSYSKWKQRKFKQDKFVYLQQYAHLLQAQGIRIVFFSVPSSNVVSFFSEEYMKQYRAAEAAIKKDFLFLDISQMVLDSSYYRNTDHLNTKGASVVSGKMISMIQNDSSLRSLYRLTENRKIN